MAKLILDLGSGNTCKNSEAYACRMIEQVAKIDTKKHEIIFKFQLFLDAPPNISLDRKVFKYAYDFAKESGYKVTASVFDKDSLSFLLDFDVPFIKIACRDDLYDLMGDIPRRVPIYASYEGGLINVLWGSNLTWLYCVPEYPAPAWKYLNVPATKISDHSVGWEVYHTLKPKIIEKHFILERDPGNPDSGPFACDIDQLKEIV
jgi:sialic acid synthase SpsE